jgi:hypothetical protein
LLNVPWLKSPAIGGGTPNLGFRQAEPAGEFIDARAQGLARRKLRLGKLTLANGRKWPGPASLADGNRASIIRLIRAT